MNMQAKWSWITHILPGLLVVILLVAAFGVGWWMHSPPAQQAPTTSSGQEIEYWTCSMHAQVHLPDPGKCPFCGMDLIPVFKGGGEAGAGPRQLIVTPAASALMQVRVERVERKFVTAEVRMLGKVDYDETRLAYLTAWIPGRLDRLYVDYTGITVKKGEHMVLLYSPELLSAQEELLQAIAAVRSLQDSNIQIIKETALATVTAAREKLRLWGLTEQQVQDIEKVGKPSDHLVIYAPIGGIVIRKEATQGMYVQTGTLIYTIADLSSVWVMLDAYESDLTWLRYGQKVLFTSESYPDQTLVGVISFISPVLDERTRTVKIRVNVPNSQGKLKPNMFVRAVVRSNLAAGGRVMDPDLAGKWICSMHPEIIKDRPGTCDICGMPLVTTESLGYVPADAAGTAAPLVISASAPLITGKRAVVYVQLPDTAQPTFEGREVDLGPRAGDFYLVYSGLQEGELVVTNGNFKIDSALQIRAKPSMMNPEGGGPPPVHQHGTGTPTTTPPSLSPLAPQVGKLFDHYVVLQQALAGDDLTAASEALPSLTQTLAQADPQLRDKLDDTVKAMSAAKDIRQFRTAFVLFSDSLTSLIRSHGLAPQRTVFRLHCPMAFDNRGADWLQTDQVARNPFFGAAMPKCGDVVETVFQPAARP